MVTPTETERQSEGATGPPGEDRELPAPSAARWWLWGVPLVVAVVTLAITATLALLAHSVYEHTEQRLLNLRAREGAAVLSAALPTLQTPLASAAELADATGGDVRKFRSFVADYTGPGRSFDSISLWRLGGAARRPLTVVGARPKLLGLRDGLALAQSLFARARRNGRLSVLGLLSGSEPRLGYAFATPGGGSYVAYGESPVPASRYVPIAPNRAFADLDFAIYLGPRRARSQLLTADMRRTPLTGRIAVDRIGFGDATLTLVMSPRGPLSGKIPRDLPWIIAGVGALLALIGALSTARLIERRRHAERLAISLHVTAAENRRLFSEQRGIAQTLQRALLPEALPELARIQLAARLHAGEPGLEIGGDWYDAIALPGGRLLAVVGDVSGRGARAAGTMAALRFAVRAYAAEGLEPESILRRLSSIVELRSGGHMATVLCLLVDPEARELRVLSAGHLPPVLIERGAARAVACHVGLPVGIEPAPNYRASTVRVADGATLLAFTDGLVERRGESIDSGMDRLLATAVELGARQLEELLGELVERMRPPLAADDTLVLGLRWTN